LVIAGCGAGAFGMGKLDWQWRSLAVTGDFTERTESFSLEDVDTLSIDSDNLSLTIASTEEEARIVFSDCVDLPKTFSYEGGVLKLDSGKWSTSFWENIRTTWTRGVFFSAVMSAYNRATLYLPASYTGSLTVDVQNGQLSMADISLGNAEFVSSNGYISVKNGSFGNVTVRTDNGYIKLENVTAKSVVAETDNGYVRLNEVSADTLDANTDNGAISLSRVFGSALRFRSGNGSVNG
ncbi:MAG: DUF4097 domain-containing protein, partial [Clostridia bacterium]|nr:DUF4097 domain-containing protein [Clostridia bacterium]